MKISTIFVGTFTIAGVFVAVIGLLAHFRYMTSAFHILSAISLSFILAAFSMIFLYLIETNDSIKTFITNHVNKLGASIESHERNCQSNVTKLTEHIYKLSRNVEVQEKDITKQKEDITKQKEDTKGLSEKWAIIESLAVKGLLEGLLDARPHWAKGGSYILTDEGEKALPKDLKGIIVDSVHGVKIESPEDALDLLAKIGRDELEEFAKKSNLQFKEIVALSILYAIKMSEGCK